jgi:hypothetical protein
LACRVRRAAFAPNLGHVLSISAHGLTAFAPCLASFLWREFVSLATLVGRTTTFAGNVTLSFLIHAGKSTQTCTTGPFVRHYMVPP